MEQHGSDNTIKKKPGVVGISFSGLAFAVLCVYLALLSLNYIDWIPTRLVSLCLYAFIILSGMSVMVKSKIRLSNHTMWYAVFTILCVCSCIYSVRVSVSYAMVIEQAKLLLFSIMFMSIVDNEKKIRAAMWSVVVGAIGLFIYLLATNQLDTEGRLGQDLTGNSNIFAVLFMISAFCTVYFIYFSEEKWQKIFSVIAFLLQMYALALSGGRKYFLLPIILLGILRLYSTDRHGRKPIVRNVLIGVSVITVSLWAMFEVQFIYDIIGYRMEGLLNAFTGRGEVDASTQVRQDMITKGLQLWMESPFIGHGIDTFKVLSGFGCYSHNNYVELLCCLGVLGPVVYYWFYFTMVKKLHRSTHMGFQKWYWILMIICLLVFDFGAVGYYMYPVHLMLLLACVALRNE